MRFLVAAFVLSVMADAHHEIGLPSFSWDSEQQDILNIRFSDGTQDSVVFSTKQTLEETCIWQGAFKEERGVFVTVSGSCPLQDDFDITVIASSRLPGNIFSVRNGQVKADERPQRRTVAVRQADSRGTKKKGAAASLKEFPKEGLKLLLGLHSDDSFRAKFGNGSATKMLTIISHAQPWFFHQTLTVRIYLSVVGYYEHKGSINASQESLDMLKGLSMPKGPQLNVFFAHDGNYFTGIVGYAMHDAYCGNKSLGIVEFTRNDAFSGETAAHEIAHVLGIGHDFVGSNASNPRNDKNKTSCLDVKGIMSYAPKVDQWSTCSVEDLQSAYTKMTCIKTNTCEDAPSCLPELHKLQPGHCLVPEVAISCPKSCSVC